MISCLFAPYLVITVFILCAFFLLGLMYIVFDLFEYEVIGCRVHTHTTYRIVPFTDSYLFRINSKLQKYIDSLFILIPY